MPLDQPSRSVAAAVLAVAGQAGVRTAFGIPGVHNLPFWDADAEGAPPILGVRHEQAAVYAADGLSRATGAPGLALLTSGPGAANALGAFGEAHASGSPLLVVASDVSTALRSADGPRGILHEMADQAAMFAAFGAPARTARDSDDAVRAAAVLLTEALAAPAGPAYLGVPTDVLGAESAGSTYVGAVPGAPPPPAADDVHALAALVRGNQRVVLWCGGGVVAAGAEDAVRELAEHLGAAVVTTYAARGLMAGHPLLVDVPPHEPEVAALVGGADLLLGLGSSFDGMNTRNWRMPVPPRRAAVGLDPALGRTLGWDLLVPAGLAETLAALAAALDDGPAAGPRAPWSQPATLRPAVMGRIAADPRTAEAAAFVAAVDHGWPTDGSVVCDMAIGGYWVGGYSSQPRTRRLQYPVGWGTLGFALPAAIGPASAGITTLAVCGDGGPMFALGELATIAQESLPVTLLVVDDGGYGMLRFDQQVFGHPERGVDLLTPDWVALAGSFGIFGTEVPDVPAVPSALRAAHEANLRGEPRVVVLRERFFPPRTTSPRWFED